LVKSKVRCVVTARVKVCIAISVTVRARKRLRLQVGNRKSLGFWFRHWVSVAFCTEVRVRRRFMGNGWVTLWFVEVYD